MLTKLEFILPFVFVALILLPLVKVFTGKATKKSAKRRLYTHISLFFGLVAFTFMWFLGGHTVFAAAGAAADPLQGTVDQGLGYVGAALATGLSSLGAGVAVGGAAPAAIGALSESDKNFAKSLIFVALGEGIAIYGLLISILIFNRL
jgi:V/A-type H+/Na+-transporting ATPase subunit K